MNETTYELDKTTVGFGLAGAVAVIFNTLLVIAKEKSPTFLAKMKGLFAINGFAGHHWITHGVSVVLVFLILGYLFSKSNSITKMEGKTLAIVIATSAVLSVLVLAGYFVVD